MESKSRGMLSLPDGTGRELVRERQPIYFNTMVGICVIMGLLSAVLYMSVSYLESGAAGLKGVTGDYLVGIKPWLESGFWLFMVAAIVSGCLGIIAVVYGRVYWPRPRYQIWNEILHFLSDLEKSLRYRDVYDRLRIRIKRVSRHLVKVDIDYAGLPINRKKITAKIVDNSQFFDGAYIVFNSEEHGYTFYLDYEKARNDEII